MKPRSKEPIRIGVLFSQTGVTSVIENSERLATILAAEEINQAGGINGRELQLLCYDPESRPVRYQALAEKLMLEDGVRIILGCYMSSTRKAVIPVVERSNALLLYPTLYEGFEYSRNVFYTGAAPNQNSVQLAEFMLGRFGSRVLMVGSDYIYPYESNRIMSDLILERGGEKVAEVYLPLDAAWEDFLAIAKKIKNSNPDFIFSTVVGDGTALLHRAYAKVGLDPARMPIASLTTCEAEVRQMGADIAEGHITSAPYFQSVANPVNERCVAAYKQRFGAEQVTNQCWEAAYFQMRSFVLGHSEARRMMGDTDARRSAFAAFNALLDRTVAQVGSAAVGDDILAATLRVNRGRGKNSLSPTVGKSEIEQRGWRKRMVPSQNSSPSGNCALRSTLI
jgi:branched-chain amino acid transport system substrate-binding protein